jgi:imidazolonepropionase-like amidohydrolase
MRIQAEAVVAPARERPLVIRDVRLFDPTTLGVTEAATIVIDGDRIRAVIGPDDPTRALPAGADVLDAAGLTALPGLWDMHAHHDPERTLHVYSPFHLAAGVTTTRDMGSDADLLLEFRDRIERGEAIGPRIIMAGFIDGVGGSRTGVQVADSAQAVAAVDRYAEMGFVQIKIYNELPPELVRVVIDRARRHGMRVSGHVPWAMTAPAAVEAGFDELQHMTSIMEGVVLEPGEDVDDDEIARRLAALRPESQAARDFIALLVSESVAVDPTLAFFYAAGTVPPRHIVGEIDRFPQPLRRQRLVTSPPQWAGSRWDEILANMSGLLRAFHQAGVPLLPGTDATPGFALHEELELYVEEVGIPPAEVLALATIGAARVMGMDHELGSIRAGKLADLILVDGDPMTDIADIRRVVTVIKDGQVFDPALIYALFGIRPCCP